MSKIEQLRIKVNSLLSNLKEDDEDLAKLENFIDSIDFINHKFLGYINDPIWVVAVDPAQICNRDSEEDKTVRGSAIFTMLLANKINNFGKSPSDINFLDFGCGEGHTAKFVAKAGCQVYSYDIEDKNKISETNFTTNFNDICARKYDIIFLYDVLDHVLNENPVDILKRLKPLLTEGGKIIIRFHPWSSRHGTHLWSLNKAYAHLFLSDKELEKLGHKWISTRIITHPKPTYQKWIKEAGLTVESEVPLVRECGIYIENGLPGVKNHLMSLYPKKDFNYEFIETEYIDYVLC